MKMFNRRGGPPAMWPWIRAGAHLVSKDLRGTRLRRARLSGANLRLARMSDADLTKANLSGAKLDSANMFGAKLQGADLRGATLTGTYLKGADLTNARLGNADLTHADLSGTKLSGAELRGANFEGVNLINADLHGQDLRGAHLARVSLSYADLAGADLSGADLSGAALDYADLRDASLQGADLSGTNLSNARLYDVAQITDVISRLMSVRWSSRTRWPGLWIAEKMRECSEKTEPGMWQVVGNGRLDSRQPDLMPTDPQQDLPHLVNIIERTRLIARWTSRRGTGLGGQWTWENVEGDRVAVHRQLEIIAEAVDDLSEGVRDKLPDTRWCVVILNNIDYRHVAGKEFFPREWSIVRQVATVDIPDLERKVVALLRTDFPDAADAVVNKASGEEAPSGG